MTSLELVDFINEDRKQQAKEAGAPFPSKEYPELRHDHFMAKVPKVLGEEHAPKFRVMFDTPVGNGAVRKSPGYTFPKRESCLMAMSYSYELQAKVYDHMTALEEKATGPQFEIPKTLSSALRLAAAQAEQIEQQRPRCLTGLHSRATLRFRPVVLVLVSPGGHGGRRGAAGDDRFLDHAGCTSISGCGVLVLDRSSIGPISPGLIVGAPRVSARGELGSPLERRRERRHPVPGFHRWERGN